MEEEEEEKMKKTAGLKDIAGMWRKKGINGASITTGKRERKSRIVEVDGFQVRTRGGLEREGPREGAYL